MDLMISIVVPLVVVVIPIAGAAVWTIATLKNQSGNLCKELAMLRETVGRLDSRMDGFNRRMDTMENRCLAHRAAKDDGGTS